MARFYNLVFLFSILFFHCSAQVDTEFWFAPPEITYGHGDRPLILRISSQGEGATVRVLQPARDNLELVSFSIAPYTTRNIDLTNHISDLETIIPNTVMKTGLQILSSAPITAYYEEASFFNAEIFVLKGKNALGNKFILPAQNIFDNSDSYFPIAYFSFDIVATKDNTIIKVRPTEKLIGYEIDSVITIRLNAGETYSFKKETLAAVDNPSGTLIESSKPIAITIKDDSVINGTCRDLLGDQLVPVGVTGKEYIVLKGFLSTPEYLFIMATEDDTEVFLLGINIPIRILDQGETYRSEITQNATYIVATKNVYVIHVTGFGCELGMAILPKINCTGSKQIAFTRSNSEFFGMNILVRKEGIFDFTLNGSSSLITADKFTVVPGTNDQWYTAQLSFTTAQVPEAQASLIANNKYSFQAGIINGNAGTSSRYGYFSSFSTLFIGDDFDICEGSTASLDAGPDKESYLWSTGETTQIITISETGDYWVRAVREGCILSDTIHVNKKAGKIDLGPDVKLCLEETSKIDGKENFSWLWSDGSTGQYLQTKELGKYWISVFDEVGCPASDTIVITRLVYEFDAAVDVTLNFVSVDTTDEKNIKVSWTVTDYESVASNQIHLYKRLSGSMNWELESTLPANLNLYEDNDNATTEEVYEYYVSLANPCGEEQRFSKIHNSIRLTGQSEESNVIRLNWNHYLDWVKGVESYELWRRLEEAPEYKLVTKIAGSENSFSAAIANEAFHHDYLIRAVEAAGTGESWSNKVQFDFEHPVEVPNVITPNNDPFNQFFEIKNIQLYKNSHLRIMDRWGMVVFEVNGYINDWDGGGISSGVYYYILNLNRNGSKPIKGTLSVLY